MRGRCFVTSFPQSLPPSLPQSLPFLSLPPTAMIRINDKVAFKPSTLVRVTAAAPVQADLTASFVLMDKLLLGAMYRTGDAFGLLLGFNITEEFHIGYSFD